MAEAENLLWEQDLPKEQSGDRRRGEQATSLGLPDMEAASAWGAGGGPASVRGSAYGCLVGALGSLRSGVRHHRPLPQRAEMFYF